MSSTLILAAVALMVRDVPQPRATLAFLPVVFFLTLLFLRVGRLTVLIAALIAVLTAVWLVRLRLAQRLAARRGRVMASYLGVVSSQLRAGATLAVALSHAAVNVAPGTPAPLAAQLRAAAHVAAANGEVSTVFAHAGFTQLGQIVAMGQQRGVALGALVEKLQQHLDTTARHAQATASALQGPQSTAVVLTLLPLFGLVMGAVMGAHPLSFLMGGGVGGVLLVVGISLMCAGVVWSQTILSRAGS